MHYQPKIDLRTGEVTRSRGAAALASTRSAASSRPADFIPLAEQTGLIQTLTAPRAAAWCSRRSPSGPPQRSAAPRRGQPLRAQPRRAGPRVLVAALLADARLDAAAARVRDHRVRDRRGPGAGAVPMLTKLTALGIGGRRRRLRHRQHVDEPAALDAAAHAQDRPVLRHRPGQRRAGGASLVRAIIELAHEFDLIAVAEGVEDIEVTQRSARARLRRRPGLPLVPRRSPRPSCDAVLERIAGERAHPKPKMRRRRTPTARRYPRQRDRPPPAPRRPRDLVRASQRARGESVELVDELLAGGRGRAAPRAPASTRCAREQKAVRQARSRRPRGREGGAASPPPRTLAADGARRRTRSARRPTCAPRSCCAALSNVVEPAVPAGGEDDYVVLEHVGTPRDFAAEGFEPRDHLELGERLRRHRHRPRREGVRGRGSTTSPGSAPCSSSALLTSWPSTRRWRPASCR